MEGCNLNFTLFSFHLLFCLFIFSLTATHLMSNPIQDVECSYINCGQGTCKGSNASLTGIDCECKPGWKKIQIGPLTFASCLVPNCSLDFQCGNEAPPPPPPPPLAPLLPPPQNSSKHCALVWCGDGTCVTNGTGYTCQCYEGSANLLSLKGLPCFKKCYFGADCNALDLGFGPPAIPSPPPPPPPPPPSKSGSAGNGLAEVSNCSRNLRSITILVLAATLLVWF